MLKRSSSRCVVIVLASGLTDVPGTSCGRIYCIFSENIKCRLKFISVVFSEPRSRTDLCPEAPDTSSVNQPSARLSAKDRSFLSTVRKTAERKTSILQGNYTTLYFTIIWQNTYIKFVVHKIKNRIKTPDSADTTVDRFCLSEATFQPLTFPVMSRHSRHSIRTANSLVKIVDCDVAWVLRAPVQRHVMWPLVTKQLNNSLAARTAVIRPVDRLWRLWPQTACL